MAVAAAVRVVVDDAPDDALSLYRDGRVVVEGKRWWRGWMVLELPPLLDNLIRSELLLLGG